MNCFVVIRHGESVNNAKELITGQQDVELSKKGIEQAKNLALELEQFSFDVAYCSMLKRSYDTAKYIYRGEIIKDERLNERKIGIYENQHWNSIDWSNFDNINTTVAYDDVELLSSIYQRVSLFLDELNSKHKDETILISCHAGTIRCINAYFNGIPESGVLEVPVIKNCSYLIFEK